jgi:hypothetical protein
MVSREPSYLQLSLDVTHGFRPFQHWIDPILGTSTSTVELGRFIKNNENKERKRATSSLALSDLPDDEIGIGNLLINAHVLPERPPVVQKDLSRHPQRHPACTGGKEHRDDLGQRLAFAYFARLMSL